MHHKKVVCVQSRKIVVSLKKANIQAVGSSNTNRQEVVLICLAASALLHGGPEEG